MKYIMIVFLVIVLGVLLAGHAGLYFSWVWLFGIKVLAAKKALGISLGILAISFVVAAVLVHIAENSITETLYIVASIWLGFVWYATLATVFALLLSWVYSAVGFEKVTGLTTAILLLGAAIYTGYGMWNAQQVRVRHIELPIPNLPDAWVGKKVAHLSDIHLGVFHRQGFMQKVAQATNEQHPDIVFVTGDLFDGAGQKYAHLVDPLDDIDAPLGRYFITGNHETYIDVAKALEAVSTTHTTILRDELITINGLQILGIDYPNPGEKKDFAQVFEALDPKVPSVVLYHEPKANVRELAVNKNASLMLSGHTHEGQLWPFGYITRALYKEFHQGFHYDGSLATYTSSGIGTWGPPLRTGTESEILIFTFTKG